MLRIIFFGLITAAAEVLGGAFILFKKDWSRSIQESLMALSAGFLLALVFFELIPESLSLLGKAGSFYILMGFAVLHFFEHTIVGHLHFGEETHNDVMVSPMASVAAISGLLIHAFFDGLSISAGMQFNYSVGLLIFIAIVLHKFPEGLTIASVMLASNRSRKAAFLASVAVGGATMLGILAVFLLSNINKSFVGITFAFTAGTVCYVGASDLIPEINRSGNRITPIIVLAGMLLFYLSQNMVLGFLELPN